MSTFNPNWSEAAKMQYVPFASDIEIPFYASLASHKINHDKLDDSARKVLGLYEIRPSDAKESSCRMQIHGNALTSDEYVAFTAQPRREYWRLV
jgi:ubiquitin-like modifier-activating enzyme ATG7